VRRPSLALLVLAVLLAAACSGGQKVPRPPPGGATRPSGFPGRSAPVLLDPARFSTRIDHPYWPMRPGDRWTYRQVDPGGGQGRIEVTVTDRTRTVLGVEARVVHDVRTVDGRVVEETDDWYAQDTTGNLWYLGEDTRQYQSDGVVSTKGAWQAGVDGAQPGILLPARPRPGMTSQQERFDGRAEDRSTVLGLGMRARVPYGFFDHLLVTKEWTPLEPNVLEHKFYAPGVGPVLAITVSGGSGREELLRFEHA
jgi:hypothetical protein